LGNGSEALSANRRWLDYNAKIFLGAALFMIDGGSPYLPQDADIRVTEALEMLVLGEKGTIFRFPDRLGRASALNYPGWFRSFTFSVAIATRSQVRRIVHIESDTYILSRALDFINATNAGWTVFWCAKWGIPETSLQIVCDECFTALDQVRSTPYATRYAGKPLKGCCPTRTSKKESTAIAMANTAAKFQITPTLPGR
jgi:hypothetical protein